MQVAGLRLSFAVSLLPVCVPRAQAQVHPPESTTSKTAYCIENYVVVPNTDVQITNGYFLNQHLHDDASHPFSSIVPTSGNTGSTGLPLTVTTTRVGQSEYMDVCCDVGCYRDSWFVGYGDLVSFGQGAFWVLIGTTTAHPDNHWGTNTTVGGMKAVAEQYHSEYPTYDVIAINDLALQVGGIFDLNLNWGPPHYNHSRGKAVDVRGNGGPNSVPRVTEIQNRFMEICTQWGASIVLHESPGTSNEHFHCEWS